MSSPVADGVLAATHKLVQQALSGQWQEVPRTIAERRALLDRLSAGAAPRDQPWLNALRQAMAESDAAVAQMARPLPAGSGQASDSSSEPAGIDSLMHFIRQSR